MQNTFIIDLAGWLNTHLVETTRVHRILRLTETIVSHETDLRNLESEVKKFG